MKTLKPQLHIHINNNQKAIGVDSFKTPVEQTLQTPSNPPNHAGGSSFFPSTAGDPGLDSGFQTPYNGSRNASAISIGISKEHPSYQNDGMDLDDIERPFPLTKCSSVSSMASSIMAETEPLINNIEFEERFDMLLSEIYMSYSMNPETTPFNIRFPPGGVISMVSKDVFDRCLKDKIPLDRNPAINHELFSTREPSVVLAIIRKRLLDFCNRNMDADSQYSLSRQNSACSINFPQTSQAPFSAGSSFSSNASTSSTTQAPKMQRGKPSWLHSNLNSRTISSTDSLVDSVSPQFYKNKKSNAGFTMVTPPSSSQGAGSFVDEFSFERKERSNNSTTSSNVTGIASAGQGRIQPQVLSVPFNVPSTTSPQFASPIFTGSSDGVPVLQSPFHEKGSYFGNNTLSAGTTKPPNTTRKSSLSNVINAGSVSALKDPLDLDLDPLYNVTSQRKRDSLKLKRNLR